MGGGDTLLGRTEAQIPTGRCQVDRHRGAQNSGQTLHLILQLSRGGIDPALPCAQAQRRGNDIADTCGPEEPQITIDLQHARPWGEVDECVRGKLAQLAGDRREAIEFPSTHWKVESLIYQSRAGEDGFHRRSPHGIDGVRQQELPMERKCPRNSVETGQRDYSVTDAADTKYNQGGLAHGEVSGATPRSAPKRSTAS